MKKGLQFLVSIVLLVSLVGLSSCNKEEQGSSIQFTATMEDCADVHNAKTVLNGTVLQWVAGDKIVINSVDFTATPLNPPTMATFTTTDANFATAETYLAYYPKENSFGWNNTVMLPSTQESEDGSLRGFPMHAYSVGSTNLQFRNLCGVLKLNLQKSDVTVTSIALTMDQKINGIYDVVNPTSSEATLSSIPRYNAGGRTTTLVCNQSINTAHDFYIYLPAGTYTGLTLEITTTDGMVCTKGPATSSVVIERSKYSTLTLGGNDLVFRPIGSKGGLFSVSATQQVWFSQGNVQYRASTGTWRFAENQWDFVGTQTPDVDWHYGGTVSGSDNRNISSTYDGWIDLYGWGTGSNPTLVSYAEDNSAYSTFVDWGVNAISNGGNVANIGWRTLTIAEWNYLFSGRTDASSKFGIGNIEGLGGMILLPDSWTLPSGCPTFNPGLASRYNEWTHNNYDSDKWAKMEAAGAVFLPAAGGRFYRVEQSNITVNDVGVFGSYWSSTSDDSRNAYYRMFVSLGQGSYSDERCYGRAVRLVRNKN